MSQLGITTLLLAMFCTLGSKAAERKDLSYKAEEASFCEISAAAQNYDQKIILVKAVMLSSYHSVVLYDPKCMPTEEHNTSTQVVLPPSLGSPKLMKKLSRIFRDRQPARVEAEGVFCGSGGPYGPDGAKFRFIVRRLISVEKVSKKEAMQDSSTTTTNPKQ